MRVIARIAALLGVFAVEANAQEGWREIDVIAWLDGCAKLTQLNGGMVMDLQCVSLAMKYCPPGRPGNQEEECYVALGQALDKRSAALADALVSASTKAYSLQEELDRLKLDPLSFRTLSPCPEDLPQPECSAVNSGLNWIFIRSLLHRLKQREEWQ